jgi:hypothetical protein
LLLHAFDVGCWLNNNCQFLSFHQLTPKYSRPNSVTLHTENGEHNTDWNTTRQNATA